MNEAFVQTIAENLYDDTPRLVYADWLDEHGDPDRAEFIRVQCELEPMRDQYEIDRAVELHHREDELLRKHEEEWLDNMPKGWDDWRLGAAAHFCRGFVDTVSMPVRTFLDLGSEIRRLHPAVRRMVLFRVQGYGDRVAMCPALDGLAELELACWYSDVDAKAIAAAPYLSQLQVLELWLGRRGGLTDTRLCRIMAGSKAWPRLRELTLLNLDGQKKQSRKRLVSAANKLAGRKVAVYHRGYPELFPFAFDYRYAFPGYLPDGRMAMVSEDYWSSSSSPNLYVVTFDRKGNQTKDVLTLPLPADLLAIPRSEWYQHEDRMRQHLSDAIGFRPGFIRVRECHFPWDELDEFSPSRGHDEIWEDLLGYPDIDTEESWEDQPGGNGGRISWLVREGQYTISYDAWADKRGQVHST